MAWTRDWLLSWKPCDIWASPVTYKVAKCWISRLLFGWRPASTVRTFLWRSWKRETRSRKKKYGQGSHRETSRVNRGSARKVDKDWAGQTHSNRCCWQTGQGPDSWGSKMMLQFLWHLLWESGHGFLTPTRPARLPQEPLSTPPPPEVISSLSPSCDPQVLVIIITLTIKLEKAMAPHSSTLAWKVPWIERPGGLPSMGSRRVRHDWATSLSLFTFMHWRRKWQPTPVFLPGESQGWGSLVGCRLWGCTELDTTEAT